MAIPTLTLATIQATPFTNSSQTKELKLGDGYEQMATVGKKINLKNYSITTPYLPITDSLSLVNQLSNWRGVQAFYWTPDPGVVPVDLFVCASWQLTLATGSDRQLSATFEGVIK